MVFNPPDTTKQVFEQSHGRQSRHAGEIRPSEMKWGAYRNVGQGETMNPLHILKGCVSETLRLRLRAPQFYPDPHYHYHISFLLHWALSFYSTGAKVIQLG